MDWYKDWTKNENEKKGKTFRRPVKAELPKVGGGTTNAWTLVMLFTSTRVRVSKF